MLRPYEPEFLFAYFALQYLKVCTACANFLYGRSEGRPAGRPYVPFVFFAFFAANLLR